VDGLVKTLRRTKTDLAVHLRDEADAAPVFHGDPPDDFAITQDIPVDRIRRHPASKAMVRSRATWVGVAMVVSPVVVEILRKLFHL
jgi:hypothetical protein